MSRTLLAIALLLAAGPRPARAGGVAFTPPRAVLTVPAGDSARQDFSIANNTDAPVRLELSVTDVWYTPQGRRVFPRAGATPRSASDWVAPPPPELTVPARGKTQLIALVQVPPHAEPGSYFAAYMVKLLDLAQQSQAPQGGKKKIVAATAVTPAVGLVLLIDVPRPDGTLPTAAVSIEDVDVKPPTPSKPLQVTAKLLNRSDRACEPKGTLAVFDSANLPLGKASFTDFSLWPGQSLSMATTFAWDFEPGAHKALVAFLCGDQVVATREVAFAPAPATPPPAPRPTPAPPPARLAKAKRSGSG